jgi:hypothetical protein
MKLIGQQDRYLHTWLADKASEVTADFGQQSAIGSMIIVIETKDIYIKNNDGKWQKFGTNEVI